jgi:pilus assembly protein FimV
MMALAMPGAAQALGLGEIHLDSALNEPLAADIDLVGATAEDLAGITASIANRETFDHFDVDRPAFLSTIVFKVSRDGRGRAVLAIRSREACTEPLLNMLVDLRWRGGELIRQYTLLLDPPGFPSPTAVAQAVVGAPASSTAPVSVRPTVSKPLIDTSKPTAEAARAAEEASTTAGEPAARKTVRVGAKATLRGVAWRVGSRSDTDRNRMMIAIFRANPHAFEGNINRLRLGAVLTIPSATEVSAISVAEANHEVHVQMQAWHGSTLAGVREVSGPTRPLAPAAAAAVAAPVVAAPAAAAVAAPAVAARAVAAPAASPREAAMASPPAAESAVSAAIRPAAAVIASPAAAESAAPPEAALDRRVRQLESGLGALRDQLDREHEALLRAQAQLTVVEEAPPAAAPPQAPSGRGIGPSIAAFLALAAAAFGIYAWRRRPRPALESPLSPVEPELRKFAPLQATSRAAAEEAVAPSVVHEAQGAPSATPLQAGAGDPQWSADALAGQRNGTAGRPREAVNPNHDIDAETLEASYLLEAGGAFDDTDNFGDTACLPVTVKLHVDDPSGETMPVATVRIGAIPESTTPGLRAPENAVPAAKAGGNATKLDYNLLDLDSTVQHVQMPSALHQNPGFKERRTSLVDALKSAMEREPQRRDLRMKLLETYYAAAATNRQGFLDVVRKIADERANLDEGDWDKIAWMGRQIASDDDLFAPDVAQPDEEDLTNCA